MARAPAGARTSAAGPAAAIRLPVTSTTQPSCGAAVTPSKTRAGLSSVTACNRAWAASGTAQARLRRTAGIANGRGRVERMT